MRAFVGRHYVLKRLLQMIPILFGITLLTFLIMKIAPGSPLQTMINPKLSMEDIQAAEDALGLNDPIYVQYFKWLGQILQGNLGYSVMSGRSVTDIITERIGPTLLLTLTSYAISLLFGLIFGIYSATHSGSVGDYILTVLAFIGVAVPSFFLALGSVYVFSLKVRLVPDRRDAHHWRGANRLVRLCGCCAPHDTARYRHGAAADGEHYPLCALQYAGCYP